MKIYSNEILANVKESKRYRVLWTDSKNSYTYLIEIDNKKALPFLRTVDAIAEDILLGVLVKEKNSTRIVNEEEVSKRALELRNTAWKTIKDAVNQEPEIYISETRGKNHWWTNGKTQYNKGFAL
ncbi:hypothetical protein SAMN04487943_10517 [Gracilibacillus orientalis]|uniref:Uncharacterized protein n=1 Tax=Gracilibacillus orientalis TaxID=334253 RepID=A0A1I4LHL0_9BACI|nr:hypothetical protein [Gracilibacillus orientalis]SFL90326.1 hypothetical protein SAMN04487943_10517 [Gracilibacillus orientalis]